MHILDKGAKILKGEIIVFSINGAGKTGYSHPEELNWIPILKH